MAKTKPAKPPRRAALYVRISQDRTGDGAGVRRQEDDCRDLAERHGWAVSGVYRDNDRSAYNGKARPAFERLVADLRAGRVDAVVTWHPDRLTRSPRELEDLVDLIESTGASVATVQAGEFDLSTATGRMSARVVGAVARHESEHKSERIRRQRDQAATEGRAHGGRRPFGYEADRSTLRPAEAALVREAAERFLAGESLRAIATDWNARGFRAASGGEWRTSSLKFMLTGPRIAGLRVHRGDIVGPATWPAIIDVETHERIRAALGDPRRHRRGRPAVQLLSGMLRCSRCGATLRASRRGDGTRRYMCEKQPGHEGCGRVAIKAQPLEELLVEDVFHLVDDARLARAITRKPRAGPGPARHLADVEQRLDDLARDFGEGTISRREWLAARGTLERRAAGLRSELVTDTDDAVMQPYRSRGALRAAWPNLDLERKRAILAVLIDHVVIHPGTPGRHAFESERAEPIWRV
jgi:site-specific DNA recombinase